MAHQTKRHQTRLLQEDDVLQDPVSVWDVALDLNPIFEDEGAGNKMTRHNPKKRGSGGTNQKNPASYLAIVEGRGNLVWLYCGETYTVLGSLAGHTQQVLDASFRPDNQRIVTSSADNTVKFWEVSTRKEIPALQLKVKPYAFAARYSPNGQQILLLFVNGFTVFDDVKHVLLYHVSVPKISLETFNSLQFSGSAKFVVAGAIRKIAGETGERDELMLGAWSLLDGTRYKTFYNDDCSLTAFTTVPRHDTVIAGTRQGSVLVFDILTSHVTSTLTEHDAPICGLRFAKQTDRLISVSVDNTIKVWDMSLSVPVVVKVIRFQVGMCAIVSNASGNHFAIDSRLGGVYIFDIHTTHKVAKLELSVPGNINTRQRALQVCYSV
jgi:WD40 repeat protein